MRRVAEAAEPTALYRHFDADGVLLYVGISLSLAQRLSAHMGKSSWARSIRDVKVEWFDSREDAMRAEREAIIREKPRFNISQVPKEPESKAAPASNQLAYSICDAAKRLGIGRTYVYQLMNDGLIRSFNVGRRRLIAESEIQRFIAERMEASA